jgi:Spy/CpxP family protein refolding chaperone
MKGFNRYSVLAVAVSLVMLLSGFIVEAQAYHGRGHGSIMGHLLKGLDLTAQQKQQIKGIVRGHRADLLSAKIAVTQARENLLTVSTGGAFDASAIQTAYGELATAESAMTVLRAQIFSQVMPVLTADQQTKVKDRIARIEQHMQNTVTKLQGKLTTPPQSNQ